MRSFTAWKEQARVLKRETLTLYLVCRHPCVPWYAKALALVVVGYALSPIDLIPDFIPVLGYLDDLVLIPLGIMLVIRLVPADVAAECRARAEDVVAKANRAGRIAAAVIVAIWLLALALIAWLIWRD
ncbi:MAG: DUF1232 domain-containing protein [Deltaproteobacteria bacterium]|nr:DUF1232 domain-containing protein [Deltaproteobacteria bacterium]